MFHKQKIFLIDDKYMDGIKFGLWNCTSPYLIILLYPLNLVLIEHVFFKTICLYFVKFLFNLVVNVIKSYSFTSVGGIVLTQLFLELLAQ